MTAAAWAAPYAAIVIVIAWAARGRITAAACRVRFAWRCRGNPPVPEDGERLTAKEIRVFRGMRSRT